MELHAEIAAVVTGGASGLGEAAARELAAHGVRVAIFDLNQERGESLARELRGFFCRVDVSSDEQVAAGFERARQAIGQERILVNCAGMGSAVKTASRDKQSGAIKPFPAADFERLIRINLVGTFRCITQAAAGMMAAEPLEDGERGVIVNTASVAAQDGQIGQAAYSASKAAIVGMTLPIARDLMNEGIRINTIMPGVFGTPLMMAIPENVRGALAAAVPFPKRLGHPAEFASLVAEICRNRYLNGESIRLDGAIRMPPR